MRRLFRLAALALAVDLLVFGAYHETHRVRFYADGGSGELSGPAFVETATVDGLVRQDGALYDASSVVPGLAKEKDCKT